MDVCYNKLFKLLIDKGMKKTEFRKLVGISEGTLAKLSHNENISMDVIVKICRKLNCTMKYWMYYRVRLMGQIKV